MKERKVGELRARAEFSPSTINEEERTVEVVFGTDSPVRMFDWDIGEFMEVMSFDEGHVRWNRFDNGAPVLDNHNRYSGAKGVLGKVESYRTENGKGIANLRFSKREDVSGIWQDVRDGILSGISFGYRVYKYIQEKADDDKIPTLRAIDWEPMEISLAPVQADPNAFIREKNHSEMNEVEIIDLTLQSNRSINTITPTMEDNKTAEAEAAEKARKAQEAADKARAEAVVAERKRVSEITALSRKHGMDDEFISNAIDKEHAVDAVRAAILEKIEKEDPTNEVKGQGVRTVADEADKVRAAVEEGILLRTGYVKTGEDKHGGADFRGMSLLRMAEDILVRKGENVRTSSSLELASRAMSTSDFPYILANAVNKSLRAEYDLVERTFQPFCRRTTISDLKTKQVTQLSGLLGSLESIPEGAEYTADSMTEAKEAYGLAKYGKKIKITDETIINDDLDAFSRIPRAIAYEAGYKQSDIVYSILTGNPLMGDGVNLFHAASHGNLGTAGAISDTTLKEMYKLMRQQKGLNNKFININPQYLIVGPELEADAIKWMTANHYPATVANENIYKGKLQVIVEPRLTGDDWFVSAAPTNIDTIEYAFLDGEGDFTTENHMNFNNDSMEVKIRMFFAAKAIDHRGLFKNAGS
jgi:hypothetical protein